MYTLENYKQTLSPNSDKLYLARLPKDIYENYAKERDLIVEAFQQSFTSPTIAFETNEHIFELVNIIPTYRQKDYENIVFDEVGGAYVLPDDNPNLNRFNTIANGGTIPCVMSSVLSYFDFSVEESNILSVAEKIVKWGYRKNGVGVLHTYFDWFVPNYYDITVTRPLSFSYMLEALIRGSETSVNNSCNKQRSVVIGLVASEAFNVYSRSNTAVVIWGISGTKYLYTSSHTEGFQYMDIDFMNKFMKSVWILSK